jgi:RNA-directed DNA polymerase
MAVFHLLLIYVGLLSAPVKTGKRQSMKVRYREEMANHSGPESCGMCREAHAEALTGDTERPAIEPRNHQFGMPTELRITEGNTMHDDNRKPCLDPARSETLSMPGSLLHRSWDISSASGAVCPDVTGQVNDRNAVTYAGEKSDTSVVPKSCRTKGFLLRRWWSEAT